MVRLKSFEALRNSASILPMLLPISGRRRGPNTMRATTRIRMTSGPPSVPNMSPILRRSGLAGRSTGAARDPLTGTHCRRYTSACPSGSATPRRARPRRRFRRRPGRGRHTRRGADGRRARDQRRARRRPPSIRGRGGRSPRRAAARHPRRPRHFDAADHRRDARVARPGGGVRRSLRRARRLRRLPDHGGGRRGRDGAGHQHRRRPSGVGHGRQAWTR